MSLPSSKAKNFELFRNYRLPLPVAKVAYKVGVDVGAFDEKHTKAQKRKCQNSSNMIAKKGK